MKNIGAFDLRAACSGFVYGLSVADQFVRTGAHKNGASHWCCKFKVLPSISIQSTGIWAVLFGDGAGAAVLQPSDDESGVLSYTSSF